MRQRPPNPTDQRVERLIAAYKRGGEQEATRVLRILVRNYPMTTMAYAVMLTRLREQVLNKPLPAVKAGR